ncbi:hypothetical protein AgCh_024954 [Apium graveolens]
MVSRKGVLVDPAKIEAVSNWERPTTPTEVRSFVGLIGYYRRFVQDFAKIVGPLTRLTRKIEKFEWTEKCEESFQELKRRLVSAPVLTLPDGKGEFVIYSDTSHKGLGLLNWKSVLILKSEFKISELKLSELKLSGDIYQEIISGLKETFR